MGIQKDIEELLEQGVISKETAERLRQYYRSRSQSSRNWVPIVFGVLGALLAGFGIILVIGHNWNMLSRYSRSVLAFLPLLGTQGLTAYVLRRKAYDRVWSESVAVLLILAVGATLSLISQTYQLVGDIEAFLFLWMLLAFPIPYVLRSPTASLLYLAGITYHALEKGFSFDAPFPGSYALLFALLVPFILLLYRKRPESNFTAFHNWVVPLSLIIGLSTLPTDPSPALMTVAFVALMGSFFMIGQWKFFVEQKAVKNGYRRFGQLGLLILLFIVSFEDYWSGLWSKLLESGYPPIEGLFKAHGIAALILTTGALILFFLRVRAHSLKRLDPLEGAFLVFLFFFGLASVHVPSAYIGSNLLLLGIGVHRLYEGAQRSRLGTVNLGALILVILILSRFFEVELSFLARGIIFILLGLGFFGLNYWIFQKRRTDG